MTHRIMSLVLAFTAAAALAAPRTAPAPFALAPKTHTASPAPDKPRSHAGSRETTPPIRIAFEPALDAWTARSVVASRLSIELASAGRSRVTTMTSRRVMLAREELARTKKAYLRTSTLKSIEVLRNGTLDPHPADAALIGRPVGLRLSAKGEVTGPIGLDETRQAVARRPDGDPLSERAPTAPLTAASPAEDDLAQAWEADAGRYLGKKLMPGDVLYFAEQVRLPFLPRRPLPCFSEQRIVGPVSVNGRPGVAIDVDFFSLSLPEVNTGVSPTTGPTSAFAAWARKSRVHLSFVESKIRGGGRRVIALDGHGLLEQDVKLDATLTGALATEAVGQGPAVKAVALHLERQTRVLSGPPEKAEKGSSRGRDRSEAARAASRKEPQDR
jgi:hypothetical protein